MSDVREAKLERVTAETSVEVGIILDGGAVSIHTGIPFLTTCWINLEGIAALD